MFYLIGNFWVCNLYDQIWFEVSAFFEIGEDEIFGNVGLFQSLLGAVPNEGQFQCRVLQDGFAQILAC